MSISADMRPEGGFRVTGRFVLATFVGFFLVVAGVNAVMIRFALSTFGGVETESAYKAGLKFRGEMDAARLQADLGWTVAVDAERRGESVEIIVSAKGRDGRPLTRLAAEAVLQRPADRRLDIAVALAEEAAGTYRGVTPAEPGVWDVVSVLSRGDDRFRSRNRIVLR